MPDPVLSVENVVKEYGDQVKTRALDGVSLTLDPGAFAALVGPSGCGKSTLLNIVGLLDRPTSGTIAVAGKQTAGLDERGLTSLRAHALGFVFQFHHLLPAFTALENVMLPSWGERGMPTAQMRTDAEEMLRAVGLGDRLHYRANNLSGGQQQRVAIARALVNDPRIVLADEPTGALDSKTSVEVMALLEELGQSGLTVVLVTHSPEVAARARRVIVMRDGQVLRDEPHVPGNPA